MKRSSAFEALSREEMLRAIDDFEEQIAQPGEVIAMQDDVCDDFYLVDAGEVVMSSRGHDGTQKAQKSLWPGGSFGQLLLDEKGKWNLQSHRDCW